MDMNKQELIGGLVICVIVIIVLLVPVFNGDIDICQESVAAKEVTSDSQDWRDMKFTISGKQFTLGESTLGEFNQECEGYLDVDFSRLTEPGEYYYFPIISDEWDSDCRVELGCCNTSDEQLELKDCLVCSIECNTFYLSAGASKLPDIQFANEIKLKKRVNKIMELNGPMDGVDSVGVYNIYKYKSDNRYMRIYVSSYGDIDEVMLSVKM